MELHERIKALRRAQGLSQDAFGQRLGVSRSVVNNLERGVLVNSNSIIPLVKLMAKEFSVSEEWLLHGENSRPEYIPARGTDMRTYLQSCGASELESALICAYLATDRAEREAFTAVMEHTLQSLNEILCDPQDKQS